MSGKSYVDDVIAKALSPAYKVCVFGAGWLGTTKGYEELRIMGISVDYFGDNNPAKWGQIIHEGIYCISPNDLKELDHVVVFIMINGAVAENVKSQLKLLGIRDVITESEMEYCDRYIDCLFRFDEISFYAESCENDKIVPQYVENPICNISEKPIVLYSCVCGGYDMFPLPQRYEHENIDYYLITDENNEVHGFNLIDIEDIVPNEVTDPIRKNRFCKILGADIFSNYRYSIYIDANSLIHGKMSACINNLGNAGITLYERGGGFDCIYQLAAWDYEHFEHRNLVSQQVRRYYAEGMPRHWGAFNCNCLVRDNKNERMKKVMHDWWEEVYRFSYRDQSSFTYVLWKNGYSYQEINHLKGMWDNNEFFTRINHSKEYRRDWYSIVSN